MSTTHSSDPIGGSIGLTAPFDDLAPDSGHRFGPHALCDLVLAAPIRFGANLVTLEPARDECRLELKRGTTTLVSTTVDVELAVAAAIRISRIVGIDPLRLSSAFDTGGTARRTRVRLGRAQAELLVCLTALADGLRVEVRPLHVEAGEALEPAPSSMRRCVQCGSLQSGARLTCEVDQGKLIDIVERAEVGGFLGSYQIERLLGEGGMGRVFLARHGFLGHAAAIKLLHRTIQEDPLSGQRFLGEARVARRIHHTNVVQVLDYGLMTDGRPFMVMEYVDGMSLEDLLERDSSLEPTHALLLARDIAVGLAAAHACGAVHLDLKPPNVILTYGPDGTPSQVKLIDFGASVQVGAVGEEGTPSYMSPEHACGEPTDARSDLYALGVVLFEMLSGVLPFVSEDTQSVLRAHVTQPAPTVTSPHRALPRAVTRLVARLLEKSPADRFPTASAFLEQVDVAIAALRRKDWLRWLP